MKLFETDMNDTTAANAIKSGRLVDKRVDGLTFLEFQGKDGVGDYIYRFEYNTVDDDGTRIAYSRGKLRYNFNHGNHNWWVTDFILWDGQRENSMYHGSIYNYSNIGVDEELSWYDTIIKSARFFDEFTRHHIELRDINEITEAVMSKSAVSNKLISGGLTGKILNGMEFSDHYNNDDDTVLYKFNLTLSTGYCIGYLQVYYDGEIFRMGLKNSAGVYSNITGTVQSVGRISLHERALVGEDWMALLKTFTELITRRSDEILSADTVTESNEVTMSGDKANVYIGQGRLSDKTINGVKITRFHHDNDATYEGNKIHAYNFIVENDNTFAKGMFEYIYKNGFHDFYVMNVDIAYVDATGERYFVGAAQPMIELDPDDWFNTLQAFTKELYQHCVTNAMAYKNKLTS